MWQRNLHSVENFHCPGKPALEGQEQDNISHLCRMDSLFVVDEEKGRMSFFFLEKKCSPISKFDCITNLT